MELRNAERKQAKIKMGLQAPSGAGKTYSALLLAYGLINDWSRIALIDTENHSADLYAHLGNYQVLTFEQPFSPERYIQAIEVCEKAGMEAIILDSISHEWEGVGGILDIHNGAMMGNSFTNWAKVTPRHNAFVQRCCNPHHYCHLRSKQDYVLSEKNGKMVPEKIGLKGVTREGLDYEFTIVLELDLKHQATATKDRTQLFMDKPSFIITPETGKTIRQWCESGAAPTPAATSVEELKDMVRSTVTVEALTALYRTYPETSKLLIPEFNKRKQEILNSRVLTTQNFSNNGNDIKNG